jgi:hypothetical protein
LRPLSIRKGGAARKDRPSRPCCYFKWMSKEFRELAKQFDRQADDAQAVGGAAR